MLNSDILWDFNGTTASNKAEVIWASRFTTKCTFIHNNYKHWQRTPVAAVTKQQWNKVRWQIIKSNRVPTGKRLSVKGWSDTTRQKVPFRSLADVNKDGWCIYTYYLFKNLLKVYIRVHSLIRESSASMCGGRGLWAISQLACRGRLRCSSITFGELSCIFVHSQRGPIWRRSLTLRNCTLRHTHKC